MFEYLIRKGILVTVETLIICALGIVAATRIPVQMIPDLDVRVISVRTLWPGATPQDIEKEIVIEQERYLRNLPNLSRISSTVRSNVAEIGLEFPFGTDITEMLIRVNNALSQVPSYPENVDQPRIFANSFSSNAFMFFTVRPLEGNPRKLDMDMMLDFVQDNVKPRMTQISGVSEISLNGGAQRQIQILIDPEKLAQRQLSLNDVRSAIKNRNRDRSGGDITSGKRQYLLRTIGRFENIEELNELILARQDDAIIRLKDVAVVQMDHFEKGWTSYYNGDLNIFAMVRKEAGANVIDIKYDMLEEVKALNRDVLNPAGLRLTHIADDVHYVEESVENVWQNLFLGAILAVIVMLLFMRSFRITAIGVIGVPVCIIVAFLGLLLMGRTVNVISLAGIAFAIGMTLDNSIVVLESIELERRRGANALQAAVRGVKSVWPAVFASTMTTVLVFLPVAFVKEEAGQLYSDIAIAISAAIMASMLVAITLLPTASANLRRGGGSDGQWLRLERYVPLTRIGMAWINITTSTVRWIVATPFRRIGCIVTAFLVSALVIFTLTPPAEYLPEGEEPKVFAALNAPPGYNLDTMVGIGEELIASLMPYVESDPEVFRRGEADVPAMKYLNMMITPSMLRIISEPVERRDIEALMEGIEKYYRQFPGMRAFTARGSIITSNDGGTRSISLDISGAELTELFDVGLKTYRRAQEVFENPRIQTNPSSLNLAQPMIEVHPNWDKAAELGMSAEELGFSVAALTDGSYVDEFFLADDKIDIYLYSSKGQRADLDDLPYLPIYTPNGEVLPLASLAEIREQVDTSTIRRVNGSRTVTLHIIPPRSVPLESGVEIVREQVLGYLRDRGEVPAGVSVSISGAADQLDATRSALTTNYLVALFIIYLLLVAIFNHWGYPLLIMTSIPLGIAGGIVGLWLLNTVGGMLPWVGLPAIVQPFDMISMLGFLILMGTVVNNPILIVHRAIENMKAGAMSAVEAVNEAVEARLRPIALSTITTLFGLAPLVLIPGAGTELYRGVGAIVMFGIIGAALVTLTMLPALTTTVLAYVYRQRNRKAV